MKIEYQISLFVACIIGFISICVYSTLKKADDVKENVGKIIVINKDTLIITGYSVVDEIYLLSNNGKISFNLIDKPKVVK